MKLAPKPLPKAEKSSRADSSTQRTAKGSSSMGSTRKNVVLTDVTYTGVDGQERAVPTAYQTKQEKKSDTKNSVAVISTTDLNESEKTDLYNLGVLMAQMKWLDLYTNSEPFRNGVRVGEGAVYELGTVSDYNGAVLYKVVSDLTISKKVDLDSPAQLFRFVGATAAELYKRGVLK